MDRRQFLTLTGGAALGVSSAGCVASSSPNGDDEEDTRSRHQRMQDAAAEVGEEVEYQYQLVQVHDLVVAETITENANEQGDEGGREELEPPTAGGLWAACEFSIEHTGWERREFPAPEDAYFVYKDYDEAEQFNPESPFEIRDDRYTTYSQHYTARNIDDRGAFPGVTVRGWLVFEVPRLYELDEFVLTIPLGIDDRPHTWVFDEEDLTQVPDRDYDP